MTTAGTRIDEIRVLIQDGNKFYLRRDIGGRYLLELNRLPGDLLKTRVHLIGTLVGTMLVNAEGVASV